MAKRKKETEKHCYAVPYEVTFRGDMIVEASSPEEATELLKSGDWEDDTFTTRASITDWKVLGEPELDD